MFEFLKQNKNGEFVDFFIDYVSTTNQLRELALEIGIGRIADVIAKSRFKVKTVKSTSESKEVDYVLNVKPNVNQNATDFWKQVVYRMIHDDDGCLIVNTANGLFIADSWVTDNQVMNAKTYTNIVVIVDDDTMQLDRTYKSDDVIHLRYSNPRLLKSLKEVNKLNEDAWHVALNGFKAKAPKYKLAVNGNLQMRNSETGEVTTANELSEQMTKKLSSQDIKTITVPTGVDLSVIEGKSSLTSTEIKALKDEIFTNTALALGIPESVFFGRVSEKSDANNEFITYACDPVIEIINNAICGAMLTRDEYKAGARIYVDTLCVKHVDVIDSATNLDKLYQNGWSHNEILELLGQPTIDEEWANERRFTKNYSNDLKGGEK